MGRVEIRALLRIVDRQSAWTAEWPLCDECDTTRRSTEGDPALGVAALYTHLSSRGREYHGVKLRCTPVGAHRLLLEGLGAGVEEVARQLLELDELNRLRKLTEAMQTADSKGATAS